MANTTGIEWTDKTWNPWYGCTKVSPGCAHCYMFREQTRYRGTPDVVQRSKTKFAEPLRWKEPARVFTCSWSDWFHEDADAWRDEAWGIVRRSPHLVFQILTKRPERIAAHLPADWGEGWANVWLGTSVENRRWTTRIDALAAIPARVRFLSCEPLLGPLVLPYAHRRALHWVIAGGESGPQARRTETWWLEDLQRQCARDGIPFFLKQLGGHPDARAHDQAVLNGRRYTEMPRVWHPGAAA
jgi:protein gp37